MKYLCKFMFDGKEGYLSLIKKDDVYYALVDNQTPKIAYAKEHGILSLSFDLKQSVYSEYKVSVIDDPQRVLWVFEELKKANNLYFKEINDQLSVLEIYTK